MNNNQTECVNKIRKNNYFPETVEILWTKLSNKINRSEFKSARQFNKKLVELGCGSIVNHKFRFNLSVLNILKQQKIVRESYQSNGYFSCYKYTTKLSLNEIYNIILNNTSKPVISTKRLSLNASLKDKKLVSNNRFFKLNFTEEIDIKQADYLKNKKRMPIFNKYKEALLLNSVINQSICNENGIIFMGVSKLQNYLNSTSANNCFDYLKQEVLDLHDGSYQVGVRSRSFTIKKSYSNTEFVNFKEYFEISDEEWINIQNNKEISMIIDKEFSNILKEEYVLVSNEKVIEEAAKKGYDEIKINEIIDRINSNPTVSKANNGRYYSYLVNMKKDILKNALRCKRNPELKIFELDMSMCHFHMLCNIIEYDGDLLNWTYEDWMKTLDYKGTREEFKVYFLTRLLNKKISKRIRKSINDSMFIEKHDKFIEKLIELNATSQGTLQNYEGQIFSSIARKYKVLTRHDSFLIPEDRLHLVELIKKDMKEILPNATLVLKQFNILD